MEPCPRAACCLYAGRNLSLSLVPMQTALKRLLSQIEQLLQRERRFGCGPQPVHREMIASHLGGSITLGNHPDGGLLATLLLPRAPHDEP